MDFELNDETSLMSRHCFAATSIRPTSLPLVFAVRFPEDSRTPALPEGSRVELAGSNIGRRAGGLSSARRFRLQTDNASRPLEKEKRMSQEDQLVANHCLSRRRFIASAGILTAAAWLSPRYLFAEGENIVLAARKRAETANITVQALRGDVSALIGSGGNIAVLTGTDGKVIIDSGYATSRARITDALAGMNPGPIKHLVNTHWHLDHTDATEWMHSEGATILAHENTRKHLSTTTRVDAWDFTFRPSPEGA